jgi:hypothetical protein
MCLGVESFALVLNEMFGMLGWIWMRWLGVFIALNHFHCRWGGCWRWAHRTCTVPCLVCRHVTQLLGFEVGRPLDALSSCDTGQSGAPLTFCSDFCHTLFTVADTFVVDRRRWIAVAHWLTGQSGEL